MIKPCKIYWYLGVLVLFLVAGCASSPQHLASNSPPTDILAKVGNRVITLSEFKDRLDNLPERYRQRLNNKEAKEKFLKKVVNLSLFSIDARAQGINKEKAVRPRLQDAADAVLAREYIKREITDRITVSDEDVNDYYNRHLSRFKQPEKVKARHILVRVAQNAGPEDLAEAQNKARDLKAQLDK
jgi:peptidyl-prolyl cis-trans isomerase C